MKCFVGLFFCLCVLALSAGEVRVSLDDVRDIAERVYSNETGGNDEYLVFWSEREDFPSLGIGHFIWLAQGQEDRFDQVFPEFVAFALEQGADVPDWLVGLEYAPWASREAFYQEIEAGVPRMGELRDFLEGSFEVQGAFIVRRFQQVIFKYASVLDGKRRSNVMRQIRRMLEVDQGLYVMIDYLNFKGDGLSESERYDGQGWGLLQVLEAMDEGSVGDRTLEDFAQYAQVVLHRRVQLSPGGKEAKFLAGWLNRCQGYM